MLYKIIATVDIEEMREPTQAPAPAITEKVGTLKEPAPCWLIGDTPLSLAVRNALIKHGVETVEALCRLNHSQVWAIPRIGLVRIEEITEFLRKNGKSLAGFSRPEQLVNHDDLKARVAGMCIDDLEYYIREKAQGAPTRFDTDHPAESAEVTEFAKEKLRKMLKEERYGAVREFEAMDYKQLDDFVVYGITKGTPFDGTAHSSLGRLRAYANDYLNSTAAD